MKILGANKKLVMPRLAACLAMLTFLITLAGPACEAVEGVLQSTPPKVCHLKLGSVNDAMPNIVLESDGKVREQFTYELNANSKLTLNGEPATVDQLKPGDEVTVTTDDAGKPQTVQATRSKPGFVIAAADGSLVMTSDYLDKQSYKLAPGLAVMLNDKPATLADIRRGDQVSAIPNSAGQITRLEIIRHSIWSDFFNNFRKNLFKPLLLFFYLGFSVPLLKIAFDFPYTIYQGLTIYLLVSIGWHGGEELAALSGNSLQHALWFVIVGFATNFILGIAAYGILRFFIPKMRRVDAATVAAYYGSDSAGTFVTCLGVLQAAHIAFAAYMPVMLAVMEIPGCLVGLYLVSVLRKKGMDTEGNMSDEPGYRRADVTPAVIRPDDAAAGREVEASDPVLAVVRQRMADAAAEANVAGRHANVARAAATAVALAELPTMDHSDLSSIVVPNKALPGGVHLSTILANRTKPSFSLESGNGHAQGIGNGNGNEHVHGNGGPGNGRSGRVHSAKPGAAATTEGHASSPGALFREVFLNPGLFLLFGGIIIGFISRSQGYKVTEPGDQLFVTLFQGMLCLFLLEMGMTAAKRLKDLKSCGWRFIAFGILVPNLFATSGMLVAHIFSHLTGIPFQLGTYVLFAVLCGAASYIAVPAIQRIAIPEASPTLPLAASLGLTFSYNVTIGIPLYIVIAQQLMKAYPVLPT